MEQTVSTNSLGIEFCTFVNSRSGKKPKAIRKRMSKADLIPVSFLVSSEGPLL